MTVLTTRREPSFRQRIYHFVDDLWGSIAKENVHLRARIGLSDPADTSKLWALVGPVAGLAATFDGASGTLVPDFIDETIELDSLDRLQLVPLRIIAALAGLLIKRLRREFSELDRLLKQRRLT